MTILFMIKKNFLNIRFGLTLANRKLFSKNLSLLSLSDMKKVETTIL